MSKLLIVESPTKARTISGYVGDEYDVVATAGHVRDLPKGGLAVDVEKEFSLSYVPVEGKTELIEKLKKLSEKADTVILATDPDREGEAISWHVKELLSLPDSKIQRVAFNEVTKKGVLSALKQPREINIDLVNAQQARRALDRVVGYEISPVLWKKIRTGLSAGRVQSVATRMVVDRENEIRAFIPEEYWSIEVTLTRSEGTGTFKAQYFAPLGQKKQELKTNEETIKIVDSVKNAKFIVSSVTTSEKSRSPAPPFTTSTLQQDASRKLSMQPKKTMMLAQQLYEGVEVADHGLTGLITYMRTDSQRLSEDAVADARNFIAERYGKNYIPGTARVYKSKAAAQDAHEAIRPAYIDLPPEKVRKALTPEQYKLYKLIWDRFISCQMENAVLSTLTVDSLAAGYVFRTNHTTIKFPGFLAVYEEGKDEEEEVSSDLPGLKEGEALTLNSIEPEQHFTKPPTRYTEATLIKALEEKGIGRPSTYAPTITTITDREYVIREQKNLRPTPLGETITGFMTDRFSDIVDLEFTARMEDELDLVEGGTVSWTEMLKKFYKDFAPTVAAASDITAPRVKVPDEVTDQVCDKCGKKMLIKLGRFGRFLACEGYPDCKNTRPLAEETEGFCPLCNGKILKKKSKKGYAYYGCEKAPSCSFITWDTPQKTNCETCGKTLFRPRYSKKTICENPECSAFVPPEARGYKKKNEE